MAPTKESKPTKPNYLIPAEGFSLPEGFEQVVRPPITPGAPPMDAPQATQTSGIISSSTFGLNTDINNSGLPGNIPNYRLQPLGPSGQSQNNSSNDSSLLKNPTFLSTQALAEENAAAIAAQGQTGWQGQWISSVVYALGAIVQDSSSVIWVSIQNQNLNEEPSLSPLFWQATGSVSFAGAWSSTTTYNTIGTLVDYLGVFYLNLQVGNLNNIPSSSPTFWSPLSTTNSVFIGVWSSIVNYVIGNQVTFSGTSGNGYYIALANSLNKQPDTNPADWQQIGAPNSYVYLGAYNGATAYVPGNQVSYIGSYWINISASTGNAPGVGSSYWEQVGQAAILLQNWSSSIAYTLGMEVVFNGDIYQCILANTNETPPNSTYWYLEGSANSQTQGKNALFNPGFESNLGGYPVNTNASLNTYVADGWFFGVLSSSVIQDVALANVNNHGGNQNLQMNIINPSVSLPSDNTFRVAAVQSTPIPVTAGDVFVISGWLEVLFGGGIAIPSGAQILARLSYIVFDQNGNRLAEVLPFADVTNTESYTQISAQQTVAATYSGTPPSYIQVECTIGVNNNSGSAWVTTGTQIIFANFDDLSVVFSTDPSNGELLAKGSVPGTLNSGFSYSSTSSSITPAWVGMAVYRADGTMSDVGSGSQAVSSLGASRTFYFYPYYNEATSALAFVQNSDLTFPNITGITYASASSQEATTTTSAALTAAFSIEAWVKVASGYAGGGFLTKATNQTGTISSVNTVVNLGWSSGTLEATYRDSGGTLHNLSSPQTYNDGEWHYVVYTCNPSASQQFLYVDGVQVASGAVATAVSATAGYYRLAKDSGNVYLGGTLTEVAVYNVALSAIQIASHFNAMNTISQSTYETIVSGDAPTIWWKSTSGGSTIADSGTISGNTANLVNSPSTGQTSAVWGAVGSPSIAWPGQSLLVAQSQFLQSRIPLSNGGLPMATTSGGSGAGSFGGSTAGTNTGCYSGDTLICTPTDEVRIDSLKSGDVVLTKTGPQRIREVLRHNGETRRMIQIKHGLVTPNHLIWNQDDWVPASEVFANYPMVEYNGPVYNLLIDTNDRESKSFWLACGHISSNGKVF